MRRSATLLRHSDVGPGRHPGVHARRRLQLRVRLRHEQRRDRRAQGWRPGEGPRRQRLPLPGRGVQVHHFLDRAGDRAKRRAVGDDRQAGRRHILPGPQCDRRPPQPRHGGIRQRPELDQADEPWQRDAELLPGFDRRHCQARTTSSSSRTTTPAAACRAPITATSAAHPSRGDVSTINYATDPAWQQVTTDLSTLTTASFQDTNRWRQDATIMSQAIAASVAAAFSGQNSLAAVGCGRGRDQYRPVENQRLHRAEHRQQRHLGEPGCPGDLLDQCDRRGRVGGAELRRPACGGGIPRHRLRQQPHRLEPGRHPRPGPGPVQRHQLDDHNDRRPHAQRPGERAHRRLRLRRLGGRLGRRAERPGRQRRGGWHRQ